MNGDKKKNQSTWWGKLTAAAVIVVLLVGGIGIRQMSALDQDEDAAVVTETDNSIGKENEEPANNDNSVDNMEIKVPRKNAGDIYVVAESYDEVYQVLQKNNHYLMDGGETEIVVNEEMATGSGTRTQSNAAPESTDTIKDIQADMSKSEAGESSHSTTNVQMEGVDESDIIKTDGKYIYAVQNNQVFIIDIQNGKLEIVCTIQLLVEELSNVVEMYVDGDMLVVIGVGYLNALKEEADDTQIYYMDSKSVTSLYTYDISNRKQPELIGQVSQDGNYHTSRKIDNIIYLLTTQWNYAPYYYESVTRDESWVPEINGTRIAADSIYIPNAGNNILLLSSTNITKPDETVDQVMFVTDYAEIYVSTKSLYLYHTDYASGQSMTKIAKFSLHNGRINAVDAASVSGYVRDTFAVNEYQGKFRILTTASDQSGNNLYLFDEYMNMTGKLEGLAPGELIYAARYMGDTVYFITYRNIDPLFAVDLSDDSKPVVLGELKITGFSDYLHFWDENTLLGIGYETDPDSGQTKGLKLAMFDISNPKQLKTLDSYVIKDIYYSPAADHYKSALVSPGENMIGFVMNGPTASGGTQYAVFSWDDKFENIFLQPLEEKTYLLDYRGLYAGNIFYLYGDCQITSFDRANQYQKLKSINLH